MFFFTEEQSFLPNSENGGYQPDRKACLDNVKQSAATTSEKTASHNLHVHILTSSNFNEKAVDFDAIENVSLAPEEFHDNHETNGGGPKRIVGEAPKENCKQFSRS